MDYSKMKATKVKHNNSKIKKSAASLVSEKNIKKSKKSLSKMGISWIIIAASILVGLLAGFLTTKLITKNDVYEMVTYANGSADVYIGKEEDVKYYSELGVKCISFGKDVSNKFSVTYYYRADETQDEVKVDKVDETKEGIYYAVYTSPAKKYSTVKLIRDIFVLKGEDNG